MTKYEIVITYESNVLGSGEFWRGPVEHIDEILNLPARMAAERLVENGNGEPVTIGMWTATVKEQK